MARHKEVAGAFLDGRSERAGHMRTDGIDVCSYDEVIASVFSGSIYITKRKWSRTTSAHTNAVRREVASKGYALVYQDGAWEAWSHEK